AGESERGAPPRPPRSSVARQGLQPVNPLVDTILALFVVQRVGFTEVFRLPLANGMVIALAFLLIHVVFRGFFRKRKIQQGGFNGRVLLHELCSRRRRSCWAGSSGCSPSTSFNEGSRS